MRARSYIPVLVLLSLLAGWEWNASVSTKVTFLIGSPSLIFHALIEMIGDGTFLQSIYYTGLEAGAGLVVGTMGGSLCGLLIYYYDEYLPFVAAIVLAIGSIPILAFAPLMIVWFGIGLSMKVALAAITTFFISFAQALRGASAVSDRHLEVLRAMQATRAQLFWKAIVPGSLSWVLGSMRLNAGFCLLGAFIGEFIASDRGLGYTILRASSLYDMPRALAASIGILILATIFDLFARVLERNKNSVAQLLSVPHLLWSKGKLLDSPRSK